MSQLGETWFVDSRVIIAKYLYMHADQLSCFNLFYFIKMRIFGDNDASLVI